VVQQYTISIQVLVDTNQTRPGQFVEYIQHTLRKCDSANHTVHHQVYAQDTSNPMLREATFGPVLIRMISIDSHPETDSERECVHALDLVHTFVVFMVVKN
jgi:hypothetical protein